MQSGRERKTKSKKPKSWQQVEGLRNRKGKSSTAPAADDEESLWSEASADFGASMHAKRSKKSKRSGKHRGDFERIHGSGGELHTPSSEQHAALPFNVNKLSGKLHGENWGVTCLTLMAQRISLCPGKSFWTCAKG